MKILIICPTVYRLPLTGYGGTEQICTYLAEEFTQAGHQVTMVAPEGSELPAGAALLPVPLMCSEEESFTKYRDRLGEFDIIHDNSYEGWCYEASLGFDPPLPIVHTCHTDPFIWGNIYPDYAAPRVQYPCVVGISMDHARRLSLAYQIPVRHVYNGIDTNFYRPPAEDAKRSSRYLWLGRYTPEKDPLTAMQLAKRLRIPLDCYGDTEIVASQDYVERCRKEEDGVLVRWFPGVTREKTVNLYQTYKALLYTPVWLEPFGLILAEAQSCGMPVLTLARGSTPELVNNGISGYVVDHLSEMEAILREGCLSSIKAENCVTMGQGFSKKRMAREYLTLFEQVRAGHPW